MSVKRTMEEIWRGTFKGGYPLKKPLSVSRIATLWQLDANYAKTGPHSVEILEPLDTDAPKDAEPFVYLSNLVDFHKPGGGLEKYDDHVKYLDLASVSTVLLNIDGTWYERAGGRVEWFEPWQCWCMKWTAYKNTRAARKQNHGEQYDG